MPIPFFVAKNQEVKRGCDILITSKGTNRKMDSLYNLMTTPEAHRFFDWFIGMFLSLATLIQVAPIKINPWDMILGWIGKGVNKELREEVSRLQETVNEIWVSEHRRKILTFARECRRGIEHSLEEWRFVIAIMEEYENYCRREKIDNGVVKEDSAYVRELYHKLLNERKL